MVYVKLIAGLVLLLVAGDLLVRGAVLIARRFGVSPMVIGLTLVGFGTSLPELLASIEAVNIGAPALAIGNVVGSNIANTLLILGTAALLYPVSCQIPGLRRDLFVMVAVTMGTLALMASGHIPRVAGYVLVAILLIYTGVALVLDRRDGETQRLREGESEITDILPPTNLGLFGAIAMTIVAMAGVLYGAQLLVNSAVGIARIWGVSESLIGITVVALGTSLPELATSVMAALKRESDVALGNVIGSNLFNFLGILGVTATYTPLDIPAEISSRDSWILLLITLALVGIVLGMRQIPRALGFVFLVAYCVYIAGLAGGLPDMPVQFPVNLPMELPLGLELPNFDNLLPKN